MRSLHPHSNSTKEVCGSHLYWGTGLPERILFGHPALSQEAYTLTAALLGTTVNQIVWEHVRSRGWCPTSFWSTASPLSISV